MRESTALRVVVEVGTKRSFASAVDYPGWARGAKSPDAAVEALLEYWQRYTVIAELAGEAVAEPVDVLVVEQLVGNSTTDFGAPAIASSLETAELAADEGARLHRLLLACRTRFDDVASVAPPELRKGPRGGGRDTDAVIRHVDDVEHAYRRKANWPPAYAIRRTAWHLTDHLWEIEDRST